MEAISAKQTYNKLLDEIDNAVLIEQIPEPLRQKLRAKSLVLRAINRADIEVCGLVKPEKQIIVHLPANTGEVFLRSSYYWGGADAQALQARNLPQLEEGLLLNTRFATDASQVRSGYLFVHGDYPVAPISGGQRIGLVTFNRMQAIKGGNEYSNPTQTFCDPLYGQLPVATLEAARGRIMLGMSYDSERWLTFRAWVLPGHVDAGAYPDLQTYDICSPYYAEGLLTQLALFELLPQGSELRSVVEADAQREKRRVLARRPHEPTVLRVEPNW